MQPYTGYESIKTGYGMHVNQAQGKENNYLEVHINKGNSHVYLGCE